MANPACFRTLVLSPSPLGFDPGARLLSRSRGMIYATNGPVLVHFLTRRGPASLAFFKSQKVNAELAARRSESTSTRLLTDSQMFEVFDPKAAAAQDPKNDVLAEGFDPKAAAAQVRRMNAAPHLQQQSQALVELRKTQGQLAKCAQFSANASKAIASTFVYKPAHAWNFARAAVVHHTGSHHHHRGGGQMFQTGFRLKGVVRRGGQGGAKQHNLRSTPTGRVKGTSFKEKG